MSVASCHPNRTVEAREMCRPCYEKWLRDNNPEYKKRQQSNSSSWARLHPDQKKRANKLRLERTKNDPAYKLKRRESILKHKYGITLKDFDVLLKNQNNACAICLRKQTPGKHLHVDHNHTTLEVRGLLCHQCNWYLGVIDKDDQILNRIAGYIEKRAKE